MTTSYHGHAQACTKGYNSLNDPHVQSQCDVLAPIDIHSPEFSHQPHLLHVVYIIQKHNYVCHRGNVNCLKFIRSICMFIKV